MAENSKIPWCDHTFNPWVGCTPVSPACDHCYAEGWAKRAGRPHLFRGAPPEKTTPQNWYRVQIWNKQAELAGSRKRVFCASLADVFDARVPWQWREDLWTLIGATPHLDWLILTKRPENFVDMLPDNFPEGMPNVWIGVTVENSIQAERRVPLLTKVPATVRFLSCEPLLEDISGFPLDGVDWVICGGESGGNARLMPDRWVLGLLDHCRRSDVPFFMKQPGAVNDRISRGSGIEHDEEWGYIPARLRVREFPNA